MVQKGQPKSARTLTGTFTLNFDDEGRGLGLDIRDKASLSESTLYRVQNDGPGKVTVTVTGDRPAVVLPGTSEDIVAPPQARVLVSLVEGAKRATGWYTVL